MAKSTLTVKVVICKKFPNNVLSEFELRDEPVVPIIGDTIQFVHDGMTQDAKVVDRYFNMIFGNIVIVCETNE